MTTDPKDAEIARLRTTLNDVREETVRLNKATDKQYAQTLEKLKAERDAALAQVAMTVFCADCENTTTRTDDDRCSVCP